MSVKLLIKHHLDYRSLKGGCTGSSESTLVKIPHYWKPYVAAHMCCLHSYQGVAFQDMINTISSNVECSVQVNL